MLHALSQFQRSPTMVRLRQGARSAFARIAFLVETLALAIVVLLFLTFLIVRTDWLWTTHQWGLFWTHYAAASADVRRPVNLVLLIALTVVAAAIASARLHAARRVWRAIDHGEVL